MNAAPQIQAVQVTGPLQVTIQWSTGETLVTNLQEFIGADDPNNPFALLHQPDFFVQVSCDEWGDGLNWPGGLDLGTDQLYSLGRQQSGLHTREDFIAWMERNHLSLAQAAQAIGLTRRMIAYYKNGSRPIPKTIWLACIGYEFLHHRAA